MPSARRSPSGERAPGPRGGLPGLIAFRRNPGEFMLRMQRDHGPVSRLQIGPLCGHMISDPAAVYRVLVENQRNYVRGRIYKQFETVMGKGLLTLDSADWKPHRLAVQPAFTKAAITNIVPYVVAATNEMLDRWEERARAEKPVDLVAEMLWVTLVSLSQSLFGYDIRPKAVKMKTAVDDSIEVMFKHGYVKESVPRVFPIRRNRLIAAHGALLDLIVREIREEHRRTGAGALVRLCEQAGRDVDGPWTDQQIRDELMTIYLAGHETTALALCWTLYSLGNHRNVSQQLQCEVDRVLGGGPVGLQNLDELTYTEMVVQESLRMYPPIWAYPRDLVGDDELGGYHIPAGSTVILSPLVSHRNPAVWAYPEAFDPERFRTLDLRTMPRISYWPFGAGPRQCVGNSMAMLELKLIVSMVAQRFDLSMVPGRFVRYGDSVISLRPVGDMLAVPVSRTARTSHSAAPGRTP